MKVISFIVEGEPQAKGRHRSTVVNGSIRTYTPDKTERYENLIRFEYKQQAAATFPADVMLGISVRAFFRIPQSKPKKTKAAMLSGELRPTKKPDADNIMKVVCDSLNNIAYHDDKQIVEAKLTKHYANDPRIEVTIWKVTA